MISPCGPATKLCPQNCMPLVTPVQSGSCPTLFTATTGNPFATACPRCTVCHAENCRSFSSCLSVLSQHYLILELWLSLTEFFLDGWQFRETFKGFREKNQTNQERKNKIGKKKVDDKNHCSE